MAIKWLLTVKLYFLRVLYFVLDALSNLPQMNRFVIRKKIYIGASIISLVVYLSTSCNSMKSKNNIEDGDSISNKRGNTLIPVKKDSAVKNQKVNTGGTTKSKIISTATCYVTIDPVEPVVTCYDIAVVDSIPDIVEEQLITDTISFAEQMPEFVGGMDSLFRFIKVNLKYPDICQDICISGRVYISFVVDINGNIVDPKVIRSLEASLDTEAIRVVKSMPKWIPGKQNGKVVNVRMSLPISFKLAE